MPVPAVFVAPLAVLVLAWDEATPAVRTLLAAVQAERSPVDSILMLVPAESSGELSAEEHLPQPTSAGAQLAAPPATSTEALPLPPETAATALAPAPGVPADRKSVV